MEVILPQAEVKANSDTALRDVIEVAYYDALAAARVALTAAAPFWLKPFVGTLTRIAEAAGKNVAALIAERITTYLNRPKE